MSTNIGYWIQDLKTKIENAQALVQGGKNLPEYFDELMEHEDASTTLSGFIWVLDAQLEMIEKSFQNILNELVEMSQEAKNQGAQE